MLGWLRTQTQSIFIYGILAIIILAFTFSLGGGGSLSSASNPNNVSSVYGQPIDRRVFSNALADREGQLEQMLGDSWTDEKSKELGIPQQVLNDLEDQMLLRHGARTLGLEITDTELRDEIVKLPAFHPNGQFDYHRYNRAMAHQRRNAKDCEAAIR
ncbi:MAG: SurA N-terminal domain-containing protein, partial [Deltaproteobacteria bacterium]|nr:SurA N-terminal domain-containing protein [Deltaproteobacteria bacterium]